MLILLWGAIVVGGKVTVRFLLGVDWLDCGVLWLRCVVGMPLGRGYGW